MASSQAIKKASARELPVTRAPTCALRLNQSEVRLNGRCRDYLGAFGEVACDWMVLSSVDEFWFLLGADGLGFPAAGPEPAATRRTQRARDVAGQQDPGTLPLDLRVGYWHGGKQCLRVGV